jgi:hypothetical protein
MRQKLKTLSQLATMSAIVATIMFVPFVLIVVLGGKLFGISFAGIFTFGGALNAFIGLVVWWLIAYLGAIVYAACVFQWDMVGKDLT